MDFFLWFCLAVVVFAIGLRLWLREYIRLMKLIERLTLIGFGLGMLGYFALLVFIVAVRFDVVEYLTIIRPVGYGFALISAASLIILNVGFVLMSTSSTITPNNNETTNKQHNYLDRQSQSEFLIVAYFRNLTRTKLFIQIASTLSQLHIVHKVKQSENESYQHPFHTDIIAEGKDGKQP